MSVPPPRLTQDRWTRLLDLCRQLDIRHNRGTSGAPSRWAAAEQQETED